MKKLMWPLLLVGTLVLGVVIYKFKNSSEPTPVVDSSKGEAEMPQANPSEHSGPTSAGPLEGVSPAPTPAPSFQPYHPGQMAPEQPPSAQTAPSAPPGFGAYPPGQPSPSVDGYPKGDPYIPPPPPSQGYDSPSFPDYPDNPDTLPPPSFGDSIPMDEDGIPGGVPGVTGAPPIDDDY